MRQIAHENTSDRFS